MADLIAGEIGKTLTVPTAFDVSAASTVVLGRRSPTNVADELTMTIGVADIDIKGYGPVAAGYYVQYIVQAPDFNEAGRWRLQLHAYFGGGVLLQADEVMLTVGPTLLT